MRSVVLAFCGLLVVAACGQAAGNAASGDYRLYEATSQSSQIAVIDSRTHAILRFLPLGTPSPDWKHLYSVKLDTLADLDPETGTTLHTLRLQGDYQLPPATLNGMPGGLSQDGRWLTLESLDPTTAVPSTTRLLLIDTSYASPPRRIDLDGFFSFDAVSNDGMRVYLVEYVSPAAYHVRMYDVSAGRLDPNIIFDKSDGSEAMTGLRLAGVPSPDGHWLYSMYVREGMSPFVHALSLDGPVAFCIDLPGAGYSSDANAFHWSIAMPATGAHLFATNAATGVASELNISSDAMPALARSVSIGSGDSVAGGLAQAVQAKELGANASVITPDGKILVTAGSSGIVWIETEGLHAGTRLLNDWTVTSLALSPDGKVLWALNDAGRIAEIQMASRQVAATFGAEAYPLALMRVEAA
jgi:hypothetical protein